MYAINFNTCSADDVIERSVICHPSLLADQLREQAKGHVDAATMSRDAYAAIVVQGMADDCCTVADRLTNDGKVDDLTFGQKIIVYSLAARLQGLSHSLAQSIMTRSLL